MLPGKLGVQPKYESDYFGAGILIKPDTAKRRVNQGLIKYIGSSCYIAKTNEVTKKEEAYYMDMSVFKVGDWVMFGAYSGTLIVEEDQNTIIIPADHVICFLEPEAECVIDGLYHLDKEREPFQSTYHSALSFITTAVAQTPWGRNTWLTERTSERAPQL